MARNPRAAAPTVEDVFRLASQGKSYEIVDFELVETTPPGTEHGWIELHVGALLSAFVVPRRLGIVVAGEVLCRLDPQTRNARAADIGFIRRERLAGGVTPGALEGAPDLVVEIVSPTDRMQDVRRRIAQWLEAGSQVVVLMLPAERRIEVHRAGSVAALAGDEEFDLEPALRGFRARVSELFPTL